jgi:hypothetical protein
MAAQAMTPARTVEGLAPVTSTKRATPATASRDPAGSLPKSSLEIQRKNPATIPACIPERASRWAVPERRKDSAASWGTIPRLPRRRADDSPRARVSETDRRSLSTRALLRDGNRPGSALTRSAQGVMNLPLLEPSTSSESPRSSLKPRSREETHRFPIIAPRALTAVTRPANTPAPPPASSAGISVRKARPAASRRKTPAITQARSLMNMYTARNRGFSTV